MKYIIIGILLLIVGGNGFAQSAYTKEKIEKAWQEFQPAGDDWTKAILRHKTDIAAAVKGDADLLLANTVAAVNYTARQIREEKSGKVKTAALKKILRGIDWQQERMATLPQLDYFIENYYALLFIGEGAPVQAAFGELAFDETSGEIENKYVYRRYARILESGNPALMTAYLDCLQQEFRYYGYTRGLAELKPLFEKNFPEGELKKNILQLYTSYYHLRKGATAPAFTLKDFKGKMHSLSDYKGKILVVDVWATWCGGCIQNLPKFMEMREAYKDRDDIAFITISVDNSTAFTKWKYTLPRLKLLGMTNLLASKEESTFSEDYNITGIPRYFLLDKEGKIVSVYLPSPGEDFRKLIDRTLNK